MTTAQEQFIQILRQDVEQFEAAAERIEELLPHLGRELQEQWIFTGKARRSLIEELRAAAEGGKGGVASKLSALLLCVHRSSGVYRFLRSIRLRNFSAG